MTNIGQVVTNTISLFGKTITYVPQLIISTWIVMLVLLALAIIVKRNMSLVPKRLQSILELILTFFDDITQSTLGKQQGRRLLSFIVCIFMFILLSNWIGIIPNFGRAIGTLIGYVHSLFGPVNYETAWYSFLLKLPDIHEPTRYLDTNLGIALLVFFASHYLAIEKKGFIGYIRSFIDEPFPMRGWRVLFFWVNPFFYLNIIGQIANVVSHSFRLFGNVFGGSVIIAIVSELLRYFLVPVGLFAFFGLFSGLIQAFVFSMLAVSYVNQLQ